MEEKLLTIAIPCYNSQGYMRHAVDSLLHVQEGLEILIIDDGSTDDTALIADDYARRYPDTIRSLHQRNGGHGRAVMSGFQYARGTYFKVLDSDDWMDAQALDALMRLLKELRRRQLQTDMIITNYVYEKPSENKRHVISYRNVLPKGRLLSWDEVGHFLPQQNLLMHSIIYRRAILNECRLELPAHTFYVDNLFAYQPLSFVDSLIYLDVDLYHYFIGRSDQSVNEQIMISRIDQQLRVTRMMIESTDISFRDVPRRYAYQIKYLTMVLVVSSILLIRAATPEALEKKERLWRMFKQEKPWLYRDVSHTMLGWLIQRDSAAGRRLLSLLYTISQRIFSFN